MKTQTPIKYLLILLLVTLLMNNSNIAQNVGIGSESFTPDPSAMLEVKSTELNPKGFLPPRMTTEVRDEIQNPATGLQIFNTTTNCLEIFIPPIWQNIFCGCTIAETPTAGAHTPSETQIVWNWNVVAAAYGYKYNIVNDYSTATNNGTSSTYTQENLDCETEYNLYVWAYNNCGHSEVLTIALTTSECPFVCGTDSISFLYKEQQVKYGTVESAGKCWLDRNLGASQVAESSSDHLSYGDLFQWGRGDDEHQSITWTSPTTGTPVNASQSGTSGSTSPGNFFLHGSDTWYTGSNPAPSVLWQGPSGVNNPCPIGWRVPNEAEWDAERASWITNNAAGALASPLRLPQPGLRLHNNGVLEGSGSSMGGYYWSSTEVSTNFPRYLDFNHSNANMFTWMRRADGLPVRCIKD